MTSPWIPPFSVSPNGRLPNSMKEFWPEKPCQPSLVTQGGSMRPVDSVVVQFVVPSLGLIVHMLGGSLLLLPPAVLPGSPLPVQSAVAQYTAPGTRRATGTETVSTVFAMLPAMTELPHGAVGRGVTALPHGVPSAGPPASYTTWVPVFA